MWAPGVQMEKEGEKKISHCIRHLFCVYTKMSSSQEDSPMI